MARDPVYRPFLRSKQRAIAAQVITEFRTVNRRDGMDSDNRLVPLQPKLTRTAVTKVTRDNTTAEMVTIERAQRDAVQTSVKAFVQPNIWPALQN